MAHKPNQQYAEAKIKSYEHKILHLKKADINKNTSAPVQGCEILPDFSFSLIAQSMALRAGSVNGGCSGLKIYMSDFPSNLTVSSRTLKSVTPLSLNNFAAKLVPGRKKSRWFNKLIPSKKTKQAGRLHDDVPGGKPKSLLGLCKKRI